MNYQNVFLASSGTFSYRLNVGVLKLQEDGFASADAAGWAADKARNLLKPFLRRSRGYNFPERVAAATVEELSNVSPVVLGVYQRLQTAFPLVVVAPVAVVELPAPSALEKLQECESAWEHLRGAAGNWALLRDVLLRLTPDGPVPLLKYRRFLAQVNLDMALLRMHCCEAEHNCREAEQALDAVRADEQEQEQALDAVRADEQEQEQTAGEEHGRNMAEAN